MTASFKDAVAAVKLAVVTVKYPEEYLKAEDLMPIQALITEKLEEAPDPLPVLIVAPAVVAGAVHVTCDNSEGASWLRGAIHNVELGSLKLKVMDAKDLPKPVKMAWKSRNLTLQDSARAIRLLQRLNPALRTDDWKVVNVLTEQTGIRRIVLMDRVSAGVIKAAGYYLPGGIERCSFKLLEEDKGEAPAAEAGAEPTAEAGVEPTAEAELDPSEDGPPPREGDSDDGVSAHGAEMETETQAEASDADLEDDILEDFDTLGIKSPTALEESQALEEGPID